MHSRKHLALVLIKEHYDKLISNVKASLKDATTISITMDMQSNQQMRSFTGNAAHFGL